MSLNENIKYSKKPVVGLFDDIVITKEDKKIRKCIADVAGNCKKEFYTTKLERVCDRCIRLISLREGGYDSKVKPKVRKNNE
jgi:hypothetical protein